MRAFAYILLTTWLILAVLLGPGAEQAKAEPYAAGYQADLLASVPVPRGVDWLGDDLLVLTINGDLNLVDRAGTATSLLQLQPDSDLWVGPVVNPINNKIYASNYSAGYVVEINGSDFEHLIDINSPAGMVVSDDGLTLYVSSYAGNVVKAVDLGVTPATASTCATGSRPDGLEIWNGFLYVGFRGSNSIEEVALDCSAQSGFDLGGLHNPVDIVKGDDALYVANYGNGSIVKVAADGLVSDFAAGFNLPVGIAIDGEDIFVAAHGSSELWSLRSTNIRGTVAGMTPPIDVWCRNATTGQEIHIVLGAGDRAYDCTLAGLVVFAGQTVHVDIRPSPAAHDSIPLPIDYTFVPPYGTTGNLRGRVLTDTPEQYAVTTVIRVNGRWWTKPYWRAPTVRLAPDGTFAVDITTSEYDRFATEIASFLLDVGVTPPVMGGQPEIHPSMFDRALEEVRASRAP